MNKSNREGKQNERYRKFYDITINNDIPSEWTHSSINEVIEIESRYDGVFVLTSNRLELDKKEIVTSYKNLKEVEELFDDLKNFIDIRPIRHWLERRVRAHVFICVLSLLLKRNY